jgi:putative long chain acyl-CoA synthase
MIIVSQAEGGGLRAAHITHRRWALSALGAAAACTLTSADTVYCCLPLHHPAGLLVSVGGALVGGARLALATRFEPGVFWSEVRTYGATVVFYAGEMCRELLRAPATASERESPLRLFAGSGMRADAWRRLTDRTGVGVLEFYASTEGALVLANAAGDKVGALGQRLPGSSEVALFAYDFDKGDIARDDLGRGRRVDTGEPGVLAARLPHPSGKAGRVTRDVLEPGDAWLLTGDLARRDDDGDYWFVDRISDVIRTEGGPVPSRPIEDALYEVPEVALAVAFGVREGGAGAEVPAAAVVLRQGAVLDGKALYDTLAPRRPFIALPQTVHVLPSFPMTEGFRPLKAAIRAACAASGPASPVASPVASPAPTRGAGGAVRLDTLRLTYLPQFGLDEDAPSA